MLIFEILKDYLFDILFFDIFNVSWTACKIIEYIAYL